MKNSDLPAMPTHDVDRAKDDNGNFTIPLSGLTKREYFAGLAMQGLLASFGRHHVSDMNDIAADAVMAANALLAELERTK